VAFVQGLQQSGWTDGSIDARHRNRCNLPTRLRRRPGGRLELDGPGQNLAVNELKGAPVNYMRGLKLVREQRHGPLGREPRRESRRVYCSGHRQTVTPRRNALVSSAQPDLAVSPPGVRKVTHQLGERDSHGRSRAW
jgi:hypothetical protein